MLIFDFGRRISYKINEKTIGSVLIFGWEIPRFAKNIIKLRLQENGCQL